MLNKEQEILKMLKYMGNKHTHCEVYEHTPNQFNCYFGLYNLRNHFGKDIYGFTVNFNCRQVTWAAHEKSSIVGGEMNWDEFIEFIYEQTVFKIKQYIRDDIEREIENKLQKKINSKLETILNNDL